MGPTVVIRCLCGAFTEKVQLQDELPVETTPCHCGICRQRTGSLFFTGLRLADPAPVDSIEAKLKLYQTAIGKMKNYFCEKCGSQVCYQVMSDGHYSVDSGAVDELIEQEGEVRKSVEQLEKLVGHEWVGSSGDGGLALCMAGTKEKPVPLYFEEPEGTPMKHVPGENFSLDGTAAEKDEISEKLNASCHCGGVQFYLTRPRKPSSTSEPDPSKWWFVPPPNEHKFMAATCMCRSCRLSSSTPIVTWAFVLDENIYKMDGSQREQKVLFCTLKRYESSPGVYRDFCGTCGACIFYTTDRRPHLVDVSVGVLRAKEGARAESWLKWWTGHINGDKDAFDQALAKQMKEGLKVLDHQ